MIALGIDLGTSAVRTAVFGRNAGHHAQFPEQGLYFPAAVTWNRGSLRLGHAALSRAARAPYVTVLSVKRLLGRAADDPLCERLRDSTAVPLLADGRGNVALALGPDTVSPQTIAAALLSHVADVVELACDERPREVVLCAPPWFSAAARVALDKAATLAGLDALQIVGEATAIALSLPAPGPRPRIIAVVDVGAGGCSAAIVEVSQRRIRVLASAGDPLTGGDDVDGSIVNAILNDIDRRFGVLPRDASFTGGLRRRCEDAKRSLRHGPDCLALPVLQVDAGPGNPRVMLDQRLVDAVMRRPVSRIGALCAKVLEEAAIRADDLAGVVLAGGMACMPMVRAEVMMAFENIPPCEMAPEGSVALGAARHAASITGSTDFVAVAEKLSFDAPGLRTTADVDSMLPPSVRTIPLSTRLRRAAPSLVRPAPRASRDHDDEMSQILRTAPAGRALNVLATLRHADSEQATDAVVAALGSDHAVVRFQALTMLVEDCPELPREMLCRMIEDPDRDVRQAALALVRAQRIAAAWPVVAQRVRSSFYDRLTEAERELLLLTAASLSRPRAEALAIFILGRAVVFTSMASEQSLDIAARFLATADSSMALESLERTANSRSVNSKALCDTAARAAASVRKRRAVASPP